MTEKILHVHWHHRLLPHEYYYSTSVYFLDFTVNAHDYSFVAAILGCCRQRQTKAVVPLPANLC